MASRSRVLNCYGFALVREINSLKQLQREVSSHSKATGAFLGAVREVESDRHSAIAALVAQVERPEGE